MMELLLPLGLLGLLGIVILIIIYILKPNYQQKVVSSTYVWRLSLRYRRKRIPINRLLSLLILLCQILVITACALILAHPVIPSEEINRGNERIVVIDASANMLAASDGTTRFERAVEQARELASTILMEPDGVVTVILASDEPDFLVRRAGNDQRTDVLEQLDSLVSGTELQCTYAQADVTGAMGLAEDILEINPEAEVLFYTGTSYIDQSGVTVVDVSQEGEWNAAILDADVELVDNFYTFTVQVASYGRNSSISVHCDIYGANAGNIDVSLVYPNVQCAMGETVTVEIATGINADPVNCDTPVYAYDRTRIYVEVLDSADDDSFSYDDSITLYGGRPTAINIQYASAARNPFVSLALSSLRNTMSLRWNINIDEVEVDGNSTDPEDMPKTEGYDLYIYEDGFDQNGNAKTSVMPQTMPTDGIVILINPFSSPVGADLVLDRIVSGGDVSFPLSAAEGQTSSILSGLTPENIPVRQYVRISLYDGYEPVMYVNGDPALLVKDDPYQKVAVLSFSVNYSLPIGADYPMMLYNLFTYFLPSTVTKEYVEDGVTVNEVGFLFEVGETVTLNARGPELSLSGPDGDALYEEFPSTMVATTPGIYTASQTLLSGAQMTDSFYVKVAASESDLTREEASVDGISFPEIEQDNDFDLLLYLAIALAALLFIEWLLQIKENF